MKNTFFLIASVLILSSCGSDKAGDNAIQLNSTAPQSFVKDSLSADQIERIKKIQSTFAEVYNISVKESIENFKADPNPADEIVVWEHMSKAYEAYLSANPKLELPKKREVFKLILMRSSMAPDEAAKKAGITILTEEEAQAVLAGYTEAPVALDSVPKAGK